MRASVYSGGRHVTTVALDDKGRFIPGAGRPRFRRSTAFDGNVAPAIASTHDLPRVYDGIYRAALSYGMSAAAWSASSSGSSPAMSVSRRSWADGYAGSLLLRADASRHGDGGFRDCFPRGRFGDAETGFYRFQDPDRQFDRLLA